MYTIEKSEDELYKEWLSKNEKFLDRFVSEYFDKALEKYFNNMDHNKWMKANGMHMYVVIEDLIRLIINNMQTTDKYRGYDYTGLFNKMDYDVKLREDMMRYADNRYRYDKYNRQI